MSPDEIFVSKDRLDKQRLIIEISLYSIMRRT